MKTETVVILALLAGVVLYMTRSTSAPSAALGSSGLTGSGGSW